MVIVGASKLPIPYFLKSRRKELGLEEIKKTISPNM